MFTLRPVRDDELTAVLAVYKQCEDFLALTPNPTASLEMVSADMALSARSNGVFMGIYDDRDTMMGIIDFIREGFEGHPEIAFIELLMIAQPFRSSGLGAAVVAAAETSIKQNMRVKNIDTAVMVNNPAAIRFWHRQGYLTVDGPEAQADGTTVWKLRKLTR